MALSPKNHVKAHELLFRHFVFCAKAMARAYVSMAGGGNSGIRNADELPDGYDAEMKTAYDVMRKRVALSLDDMSALKLDFFEKIPDGYIECPPRSAKRVKIFNVKTSSVYEKWPEETPCPEGWTRWEGLSESDRLKFKNIRKGKKMVYAYDPADIRRNGKFKLGEIPAGWAAFAFDLGNPGPLLKERLKFVEARLGKAANENAVRALS